MFQAQGVSIKNLENQVGQIATALSSRAMGTLPSSTEPPASTSGTKNVETCKMITLRSGKEYEGPLHVAEETRGVLPEQDISVDHEEPSKEPTSAGQQDASTTVEDLTLTSGKKPEVMPEPDRGQRFVQERPPPPFPQRIRKAKEEQQFGKFMEILKQLHIDIPLIEAIEQMPNYSKFMKDVLTKRKRVG